jgi:hypothetical protein
VWLVFPLFRFETAYSKKSPSQEYQCMAHEAWKCVKVQKSCKKRFNREDSFKKGHESIQLTNAHQETGRYTKEPAFMFLFTERGGYNSPRKEEVRYRNGTFLNWCIF